MSPGESTMWNLDCYRHCIYLYPLVFLSEKVNNYTEIYLQRMFLLKNAEYLNVFPVPGNSQVTLTSTVFLVLNKEAERKNNKWALASIQSSVQISFQIFWFYLWSILFPRL